jgi:hypothetical protein
VFLTLSWRWKHGTSRSGKPFLCVKFGGNFTTSRGKLQQAFGNNSMSRAEISHWHKMFSECRTIVEDEQRSGLQSTKKDR